MVTLCLEVFFLDRVMRGSGVIKAESVFLLAARRGRRQDPKKGNKTFNFSLITEHSNNCKSHLILFQRPKSSGVMLKFGVICKGSKIIVFPDDLKCLI